MGDTTRARAAAATPWLLLAGLTASVVVGIGEYLLHFHPEGPAGEVDMLLRTPLDRARVGHFVSLAGVPLYFLGYLGCYYLFVSSTPRTAAALLIAGILSFIYGGIWISSRYFAAVVLQQSAGSELYEVFNATYEGNYQVLVWLLRLLVLAVSALFIACVWNDRTGLPKILAAVNPITVLALAISTLFWLKPLGIHIAPIAMNTSHFVLFAALLLALRGTLTRAKPTDA